MVETPVMRRLWLLSLKHFAKHLLYRFGEFSNGTRSDCFKIYVFSISRI